MYCEKLLVHMSASSIASEFASQAPKESEDDWCSPSVSPADAVYLAATKSGQMRLSTAGCRYRDFRQMSVDLAESSRFARQVCYTVTGETYWLSVEGWHSSSFLAKPWAINGFPTAVSTAAATVREYGRLI